MLDNQLTATQSTQYNTYVLYIKHSFAYNGLKLLYVCAQCQFTAPSTHWAKYNYLSLIATHYHILEGWIKDGTKKRIICCRRRPHLKIIILLKCFDISSKWLDIFLPAPSCTVKYISIRLFQSVKVFRDTKALNGKSPSAVLQVLLKKLDILFPHMDTLFSQFIHIWMWYWNYDNDNIKKLHLSTYIPL